MEPNVDRGMWSIVVLLAAIVIGGVVLLAFPKISAKIATNMDETVGGAFKGDIPSWVNDQNEKTNYKKEMGFLRDIEYFIKDKPIRINHYNYFKEPSHEIKEIDTYHSKQWNEKQSTRIRYTVGERIHGTSTTSMLKTYGPGAPEIGEKIYLFGIITNHSEKNIWMKNHAIHGASNAELKIAPNETKFVNIQGVSKGGNVSQTTFFGLNPGEIMDVEFYGLTPVNVSREPKILKIMEDHGIVNEFK